MDPSIFLQYAPPSGLPQESKLATYMNRNNAASNHSYNQAMSKLSLESSPTSIKKVLIGDFVPVTYYPPQLLPESPENSPPSTMAVLPQNTKVHQENVGGTTYFYATSADNLNTAVAMNTPNAIVGPDPCMGGVVVAAAAASPYASQMYTAAPPHLPLQAKSASPYATLFYTAPPPLMQSMQDDPASPYATQLYSPAPAHALLMPANPGLASSFYVPENIRSEIYERNQDVYLQADLRQYPDLPDTVEVYAELTPLEPTGPHTIATSFRATHRHSAEHYAVRRLHSHVAANVKRLEMWKKIDHPNIVRLHEYFTTKAFNDHSMMLVYDYHPGSVTLMSKYLSGGTCMGPSDPNGPTYHDPFSSDPDAPRPYTHQKNAMLRAVACGALLPEAVLWSLLVQLTAALRAIHTAGLACRSLDPTKVVVNGCRVRIAWCGLSDATHMAINNDVAQAQQDDLNALGRVALSLACRTIHCENLPASMDLVARTYSADLKNLILYLLSSSPTRRSVTDLMPMIGARFYTQVEALERRADVFEEQLAQEIDNGRLLRILIKLGLVNERPEFNLDPTWSETGDRYMLKLFRDHLFHAVTETGQPWIDMGHVTYCLNQLDGGTQNRVELMSRDEQSVLVVTFSELKHCLEQALEEVMGSAVLLPGQE